MIDGGELFLLDQEQSSEIFKAVLQYGLPEHRYNIQSSRTN